MEKKAESEYGFEAICDLSPSMSCTAVLTSEYGHIFSAAGLVEKGSILDQSNAACGLLFYILVINCSLGNNESRKKSVKFLALCLGISGALMSAMLGYIMSEILHDFCVLCVSTYVCNAVILLDSIIDFRGSTAKVKAN